MGAQVYGNLYEQVVDKLEQIVDEDPDYEYQEEADFISDQSSGAQSGFTKSEAARINALHAKYVGEQ
jgi:hypothetical protein